MNIIYTIVGCLFITAVSITAITMCIHYLFHLWQERKCNAWETWAKNVCSEIERWCDYEYPQVGFTMKELNKSISSGWSFSADQFREQLRRNFPKEKQ